MLPPQITNPSNLETRDEYRRDDQAVLPTFRSGGAGDLLPATAEGLKSFFALDVLRCEDEAVCPRGPGNLELTLSGLCEGGKVAVVG